MSAAAGQNASDLDSGAEKRIDREDGKAYTYEEMTRYYEGKYNRAEIQKYWEASRQAGNKKRVWRQKSSDALPARGRALLRACTDSSLGSQTPQTNARTLRRVQSMDLGGAQLGRIVKTRSSSSERKFTRRHSFLQPEQHEEEERAASVPPPPSRAADPESDDAWQTVGKRGHRRHVAAEREASPPTTRPPLLRMPSREIQEQVREAVQPALKVLGRDVRRQLRLIVGGLMGSGKSTLCRMLAHLLEGVWVNQDEFSHLGRGAKKGFLAEIKNVSQDRKVPTLIVDKINTTQQHRGEILEAMKHGVSGDVAFIQIAHPDDPPDSLQRTMELCLSRIRGRGQGHRTLLGTDPKLVQILKMAASGYEPLEGHDLHRFNAHFRADMTLTPTVSVMQLLADLDDEELLGRFHVEELVTQESILEAFEVSQDAEKQLAKGKEEPVKKTKKEMAPLWYYVLQFDAGAQAAIRNAWYKNGSKEPELELQDEFHVTLLYLGGKSDKQIAAKQSTLHAAEDVARLREKLQRCQGKEFEVSISSISWDNKIACAEISGLTDICANAHAHATLAKKKGVPPVLSNELLARKYANENLHDGLKEWLMQLGLQRYETSTRSWCKKSRVSTADAIAAQAAQVAQAIENKDGDQQARVKTVLTQAAQGKMNCSLLEEPVKLVGRIHGRLRGE